MTDEQMSLSAINELAKAYASSYASPHHITFTVEGLRNLIAAIGWRGCAGCPTPNDCRMHGCGVARGLWKSPAASESRLIAASKKPEEAK